MRPTYGPTNNGTPCWFCIVIVGLWRNTPVSCTTGAYLNRDIHKAKSQTHSNHEWQQTEKHHTWTILQGERPPTSPISIQIISSTFRLRRAVIIQLKKEMKAWNKEKYRTYITDGDTNAWSYLKFQQAVMTTHISVSFLSGETTSHSFCDFFYEHSFVPDINRI